MFLNYLPIIHFLFSHFMLFYNFFVLFFLLLDANIKKTSHLVKKLSFKQGHYNQNYHELSASLLNCINKIRSFFHTIIALLKKHRLQIKISALGFLKKPSKINM